MLNLWDHNRLQYNNTINNQISKNLVKRELKNMKQYKRQFGNSNFQRYKRENLNLYTMYK